MELQWVTFISCHRLHWSVLTGVETNVIKCYLIPILRSFFSCERTVNHALNISLVNDIVYFYQSDLSVNTFQLSLYLHGLRSF